MHAENKKIIFGMYFLSSKYGLIYNPSATQVKIKQKKP